MNRWSVIALLLTVAVAGCSAPDRKWMKLSGDYTTQDLRRDLASCTRDRVLNDRCMEDRGWVVMNPGKDQVKDIRNTDLDRSSRNIRY